MPLSTGLIAGQIGAFFKSNSAQSHAQTAQTITSAYMSYVASAGANVSAIGSNMQLSLASSKSSIENAIEADLNAIRASNSPMTATSWITTASAIVGAWASTQFNPAPPPPGLTPSPGVQLIYPGNPSTLSASIFAAMKIGEPFQVALLLETAFFLHLQSITGVYIGTTPNGVTVTLPWSGVEGGGGALIAAAGVDEDGNSPATPDDPANAEFPRGDDC